MSRTSSILDTEGYEGYRRRDGDPGPFHRDIVELSPDAIAIIDRDARYVEQNEAHRALLGYADEHLLGQTPRIHSEETTCQRVLSALADTGRFEGEIVSRRKDGTHVDIEMKVFPIGDDNGGPRYYVGIKRDITARKQAERALRDSDTLLKAATECLTKQARLLDISSDAIIMCDRDDRILYWNQGATKLYGWTDVESRGHASHELLQTQFPEPLGDIYTALNRDSRWEGEVAQRRRDGSRMTVWTRWVLDRDETGSPVGVLVTNSDISERKQAEEELRERNEQFRALINQATVGVAQVDLHGRFTLVNRRFCEILGYPEEELLGGMRMHDVTHPEDLQRNAAWFTRLAEGGPDFVIEKRYIRKDGMPVWVSNSVGAIRDAAGRVRYVAAVVVDVTERRRAEQQLRTSEERFRTLADNMSQFAWMADAGGSTFWFNRRWFEYTGATLEQMTGEGWKTVLHPAYAERVLTGIRRAWATGEPWEDTFPLRGSDSQYRWFLSRAVPIRDAQGTILRWLGTNTDVTEVRLAKEALQRRETQLRVITDGVPGLISYVDREERYRFVNAGYEKTFGMPREHIIGRTAKDLLGATYADVVPYIERVLAGETVLFESDLVYAGARHTVQATYKPDIGPDGTVAGFYVLVTDISERKRQETELRRWKDQLEVRVAERTRELVVSQERLRALASQLSLTEQRERRKLASDLHDYLAQLLVCADLKIGQTRKTLSLGPAGDAVLQDLHEILQQSLTYTRTMIAELSPHTLHTAGLPAALEWLAERMQKHGLWVTVEAHCDAVKLPEDHAVLLFQSVRELLFNVLKHAEVDRATVSLHATDEGLVLSVVDRGKGLDAEGLRRSAEPGHFGMLAVRERMEAMGGWLKLESEPGAGTRVELGLPFSARTDDRG